MKKIFTILCLMALTMGAQAGVVTNRASAGSPMTYNDFLALAGTGKHFAIVPSSSNTAFYPLWFGFTATKVSTLTTEYLFEIEQGTMWNTNQAYGIKRVSDGKWVKLNGAFDAVRANMQNFKPNNRRAGDYAPEYSDVNLHISLDQPVNTSNHYNANGLGWNTGSGGYSTYVAYGPFYIITVNCVEQGNESNVLKTEQVIVTDGTVYDEYTPSDIIGYDVVAGQTPSVTVNGADATLTVYYQAAATTYDVVLQDMPAGTTVTIGGTAVTNGGTYTATGAIPEINVAYPATLSHEKFFTNIDGTTITITRGTLFKVAASTGTFYNGSTEKPITNSNQFLNKWISTATSPSLTMSCKSGNIIINSGYPTDTKFNMHTDPDNYTLSTDDMYEVKSYSITAYAGNGSSSINGTTVGTTAATATTVDGTTNPIVIAGTANPWMYIVEFSVLVHAVPNVNITYVIQENGTTIYTFEDVATVLGETISELPAELQRTPFYSYDAISPAVTADQDQTIVVNATAKSDPPVQYTTDATSPAYYNAKIRGKYLVYDETATDELKLQDTSEPFNPNASWAFIGEPHGGFKVINQAKGENYVLTYTSVSVPKPADHNIQFQTGTEAEAKTWLIETNTGGIVLRMKESTNIYFHHENSENYLRTCSYEEWNSVHNDAGSTIVPSTDKEILVQLYEALNAKKNATFGNGLGEYALTGIAASDFATTLTKVGNDLENDNTTDFYTDYLALKDVTITFNLPEAGKFYRIKGYSGNYITSNTISSNATMSGAADANNIVLYNTDGSLIFYGSGLGLYNTSIVAPLDQTKNAYTFSEGAQLGKYYVRSNYSAGGTYCYDHTTNGNILNRNSDPVTSGNYETDWTLEPVTELPITLRSTDGETYFATFSAPVNVQISGASLNKVTNNNKTAAYNTVDTDMLKAGVGVLLSGTSATATATIITEDVAEADYGLVKYYAATAGTGDESMLYLGKGKTSGKAGFYKLGVGTTSNGFKAYLNNTTELGGAKEGLELEFAGVTGIENMEHGTLNMENGAVYNLQGQRVNKAQKGVYIINNKKVVVK